MCPAGLEVGLEQAEGLFPRADRDTTGIMDDLTFGAGEFEIYAGVEESKE